MFLGFFRTEEMLGPRRGGKKKSNQGKAKADLMHKDAR